MTNYNRTYSSIYRGVVENNVDPENLGRCKIRVPSVHGELNYPVHIIPWARPIVLSPVSSNRGCVNVPDIGDIVWVLFEGGVKDFPIYIGGTIGVDDIDVILNQVILYQEKGNKIVYYRDEDIYEINVGSTHLSIKEGEVIINSANIVLDGNVRVKGDISFEGNVDCPNQHIVE